MAQNGFAIGPMLQADYPQVEKFARLLHTQKQTIWYNDGSYSELGVCYVDSTFFDVFHYEFLAGDKHGMKSPNLAIIDDQLAVKYFGSVDQAVGKELKLTTLKVTIAGVVKKPEQETHLSPFKMFISIQSLPRAFVEARNPDYLWMTGFLYLKLQPGVTKEQFDRQLHSFYEKVLDPFAKANDMNGTLRYVLQPLPGIHLDNSLKFDYTEINNPVYVTIFSFVGLFILLIAGINYMNLSTARSSKRSVEVGIRKVVGAKRLQLGFQFISESLLIVFISYAVALMLLFAVLPFFNEITGKGFTARDVFGSSFLLKSIILVAVLGIFSGLYPAFYLSGFNVIEVFRSKRSPGTKNVLTALLNPVNLRKALVVLQFSLSIGLIIGTIVVFNQLEFIRNRDLGFNKDQLFVVDIPNDTSVSNRLEVIKSSLLANPGIKGVTSAASIPGSNYGKLTFDIDQGEGSNIKLMSFTVVDEDYLETLDIRLLEGRNFSHEIQSDIKEAFIINEAALKFLGVKKPLDAILENGFGNKGKVIGLINDHNFQSLHNPIEPLVLSLNPKTQGYLMIRVGAEDIPNTVEYIHKTWKTFDPDHPYESFFLDDNFEKNYQKESRMVMIFTFFSVLTILVSCLGLYGLTAFATEIRMKEIGIRKVLGANVASITGLLVRDFLLLVLVANIIAYPFAYYYMNEWLFSFHYRIALGAAPFLIASVLGLVIALITVSTIVIKIAGNNMVMALKNE
jgi:putative ABC transport system permease protein